MSGTQKKLTLLLVGGLSVAALALLVPYVLTLDFTDHESAAVAFLENHGGSVGHSEPDGPVTQVSFADKSSFADVDLQEMAPHLAQLAQLRVLDLSGTQITDAGLKALAGLSHLKVLNLNGTRITDAGLPELAALKNLRELFLLNTAITDVGLSVLVKKNLRTLKIPVPARTDLGLKNYLAALQPQKVLDLTSWNTSGAAFGKSSQLLLLERLNLSHCPVTDEVLTTLAPSLLLQELKLRGTKVTDAGLKSLADVPVLGKINPLRGTGPAMAPMPGSAPAMVLPLGPGSGFKKPTRFPQLRVLDVGLTQITDAGLKELVNLSNLQELDLEAIDVTDPGLRSLIGIPKLKLLRLGHTKITDAGLETLARLTQLEELVLTGAQATDAGVKKLRQALPNCDIVR